MEDKSLELAGYTFILDFGEYDYEWHETRIYEKDGRFFCHSQSGCSCIGWEEPMASELIELPNLDAIRGVWEATHTDYMESRVLSADPLKYLDLIEKMRELGLR